MGMLVSLIQAAILAVVAVLAVIFVYCRCRDRSSAEPAVTILVLGDIGRSPRMQYHALSLAKHGCRVSLVGYPGAQPMDAVVNNQRISLHHVVPSAVSDKLPFTVRAVVKVLSLLWQLFMVLMVRTPRPHFLLVQNPPAIPSLLLARFAGTMQAASLIIDFHNFGYSLLALKLGDKHPLVRAHLAYEQIFGRLTDDGFCVTEQMKTFLADSWRVEAVALHDRPASIFRPTPLPEQHSLFVRLKRDGILDLLDDWWPKDDKDGSLNLFTQRSGSGDCSRAKDRPRLVISSTSWTPDEDFGQLLDALPSFDARLAEAGIRAVVAITGKGDLKEAFELRAAKMASELKAVRVLTLWLSFADYASLLGSADLGLSLHTSSSGLDLPMKVVDMFGAGLPVCAKGFPALPELVRHGDNGLIFDGTEELAQSLAHALGAGAGSGLPPLKSVAGERKLSGWDENWDAVAWPLLKAHLRS